MSDNSPNQESANPDLEKILAQLSDQQKTLDKLDNNYSVLTGEWLFTSAKSEAVSQSHEIEKRITKKINNYFSIITLLGSLIAGLISLAAILGIQKLIEYNVDKEFSEEIRKNLEKIEEKTLKKSEDRLEAAQELYRDVYRELGQFKNDLIILQTDYGAKSSYMGELIGAIYHINPNARIEVTTDEVTAFNTHEAAWILSKIVKYYPRNTIFISITGTVSVDASPVILRNNEKGHTFIGYANGVFDLVKPQDNFNKAYLVDMEKLKVVLEQEKHEEATQRSDDDGQPKILSLDTKPDNARIVLGFIAGSLSRFPTPWEEDYSKLKKIHWLEKNILEEKNYEVTFEKIEPTLLQMLSDSSILIEGTIMNIDHFGNANTNISKSFIDNALKYKNLKLDDNGNVIVSVGIFDPEKDKIKKEYQEKIRKLKLKPIQYKLEYSDVEPNEPLVLIKNNKVQLAINKAKFSKSKEFLMDNDKIEKIDSGNKYIKAML